MKWLVLAVFVMMGSSLRAAEAPRVAVLYSAFRDGAYSYQHEYDADLEALGWLYERVENRNVGEWIAELNDFDLVIFTAAYNYENSYDLAQHADWWREFLNRGGVLLVTDPNYGSQAPWLAAIDPRLRLVPQGDPCGSDNGEPSWVERDHPLFTQVGRIACAWTHPRAWSPSWQVLARCSEGKPVVLLDEYGRGLVVVTVAYHQYGFPHRQFLENVMALARDEGRQQRAAAALAQQQKQGTPRLELRRLPAPPTLDGDVSEAVWNDAARIDGFVRMDGSVEVQDPTEVRVGYDDQALYVAFICHDAQANPLQTLETQRDGEVYHDDCVEVFLDPTGTRRQFQHFIVNAAGVQYDEDSGDSSWNAVWDAVTQRHAGRWTVELRIPFASLELGQLVSPSLAKGGVAPQWIANFNRNNPRSGELTGWSPTFGGFLVPERFGELAGLDVDFSRFAWQGGWRDRPEPWRRGENRVEVEIENQGEREIAGTVNLIRLGGEGGLLAAVPLTLPPGERKTAALTVSLEEPGKVWLAAQWATAAGPVWNAPPLPVTIPELLETVLLKPAYRASFFASRPEREVVVQAVVAGWQEGDGKGRLRGEVEREGERGERGERGDEIELAGDGVYELRFDLAGEPPGEYHIGVELANERGKILARAEHGVKILPPSDFEVTFDENRVCHVNGKPFFPIGLYHVCPPAIDTIEAENRALGLPARTIREHLQDLKDHGFNCVVHAWGFPGEEFRRLLAEVGLYWSPEIGWTESEDLRRLVEEHRRDPYLLWWYGIDEAAGAGLEKAIRDRALFEEVDPYHPVAAAVNNPGIFRRFVPTFDVLLPDPYPIRNMPLTLVSAWTDGCLQAGQGRVPVWVVPQAFGDKSTWEVPTPEELRCMAYLALTHGATGLIWFTYAHPGFFDGVEGHRGSWYLPETPLWEEFARLNREIADLAPVLLSPPSPPLAKGGQGGSGVAASEEAIHVLLKEYEGKHYLFTVNASPEPIECQFTGLTPGGEVEVLPEGRTIAPDGEGWTDRFEGYATRVYRF